jgi:hypothetical protein
MSVYLSGAASRRWARLLGQVGKEARLFASALGDRQDRSTDLFVVGLPQFEPWHFCAHLGEQAARYGRVDLVPTLLRWMVPPGAPSHLSVTVDTLASASRNQTVLVINPLGEAPELLERVAEAKHRGARIMTLHRGYPDLIDLSHETLLVDPLRPDRDFEMAQHLVTDLTPVPARGSSW